MFFAVENVTFHDLYDWSAHASSSRSQNQSVYVSRSQISRWMGSGRSPSRKSLLRTGHLVKVNEHKIALFRYGEMVYAILEHCPHAGEHSILKDSGGPLHIGDIEMLPDSSLCVRCPYHGWKFDLSTGKCKHPVSRGEVSTKVFPVKVDPHSGKLSVGFEEFNPSYFTLPLF